MVSRDSMHALCMSCDARWTDPQITPATQLSGAGLTWLGGTVEKIRISYNFDLEREMGIHA